MWTIPQCTTQAIGLRNRRQCRSGLLSHAVILLPPANEVFTGVCLSTGGSRSLSGGSRSLSRGSLSRGVSVQGESLSKGVSVGEGVCPGGSLLCQGGGGCLRISHWHWIAWTLLYFHITGLEKWWSVEMSGYLQEAWSRCDIIVTWQESTQRRNQSSSQNLKQEKTSGF